MILTLDTVSRTVVVDEDGVTMRHPLYSAEAFRLLSRAWVQTGWALKYSYSFTWLGRPIIQLPEDLVRMQEVVDAVRPDVLVETGVAHGGSLVFHATLFRALGRGRVIGIDIDIRPRNREAIEVHPLGDLITLIQGSSTDASVLEQVRASIRSGERVLVVLDSNHSRDHVLAELRAFAPLVSPGSYIVATDGIMEDLADVPGGEPAWRGDNPCAAVRAFLEEPAGRGFALEEPPRQFQEGAIDDRVTYWPSAFLRRKS